MDELKYCRDKSFKLRYKNLISGYIEYISSKVNCDERQYLQYLRDLFYYYRHEAYYFNSLIEDDKVNDIAYLCLGYRLFSDYCAQVNLIADDSETLTLEFLEQLCSDYCQKFKLPDAESQNDQILRILNYVAASKGKTVLPKGVKALKDDNIAWDDDYYLYFSKNIVERFNNKAELRLYACYL